MTEVISNDFIQSLVDQLRDTRTQPADFYRITETISQLLTYEALKREDNREQEIPMWTKKEYKAKILDESKLMIVPVLRAGIGMLDGVRHLLPGAKVQMLGMYRNEDTLEPIWYYNKLPEDLSSFHVFLIDPMLATGGTLYAAVKELKSRKCSRITVLAIVASPEGINSLEKGNDDIKIIVAAIDDRLNDEGYILPGLGDAGDRIFNT